VRVEVKLKKNVLIIVILICFTPINCKAVKKEVYKVDGLTDEIYYRLSGAWDRWTNVKTDYYEFSWGKGKWVYNESIIIDFGANPPEFYIGGITIFDIISIEMIGEDAFKLNVQERWERKQGYFIIHTNVNGAIWFGRNPEFNYFTYGRKRLYYRISGPEKPKN